jgi:uncharacterized coiled-coil DUF342 family protein
MWFGVAFAVVKSLIGGWLNKFFSNRQEQEDIKNAVQPYKDEAEALSKPSNSIHDNVVRLRDDE